MKGKGYAMEVRGLTKVYRSQIRRSVPGKVAVDGIDFDVSRGEIFGLLGPNGAGKTTTIKMLTTLLLPTSGSARVLGMDVVKDALAIRARINLVSGGERGLYYRLTGRQNLRFFSDLYRVPLAERDERADRLLGLVGLQGAADVRVEDYSRGMKQRLHIARGLVNDPEILFLDEPTIGLDPEIARDIRSLVREMADGGMTIMLTTHDMREADMLCDRIGLLSRGSIVAMGPPEQLKDRVRTRCVVEVEVEGLLPPDTETVLGNVQGVQTVTVRTNSLSSRVRLQVDDRKGFMARMGELFSERDILSIRTEDPTLEDAYLALVTDHVQS